MPAIENGRICILTAGRRKGEEVMVTKMVTDSFVLVVNKKGKERKCAVAHLQPTERKE